MMHALLEGKVALVTGAARGQGRAHALTCARQGADVVLFDALSDIDSVQYPMSTKEDLEDTARAIKDLGRDVVAVRGDVRSQQDLDTAVAAGTSTFGQIDILIANAGLWSTGPFWEMSEEQWNAVLDICLTGVWKTVKAVAPHMIERKSGSVVVTSSVNAYRPSAGRAHYSAAKNGVLGLMKTMAIELAPHGVRVNAVCPGAVNTPACNNEWSRGLMAGDGRPNCTDEEYDQAGRSLSALPDIGFLDPQSIADAALFLNSDLASAVTGIELPVDAGNLLLT